jgi:DNA-directed RNA polymerase subunit K
MTEYEEDVEIDEHGHNTDTDVDSTDTEEEDEEEGSDEEEEVTFSRKSKNIIGSGRTTTPRMSAYEYARLLETRASQIENGSHIGINTDKKSSIDIAEEEIKKGKCPLYVARPIGDRCEIFQANELEMMDCGLSEKEKKPVQKVLDMSIEQIIAFETGCLKIKEFKEKNIRAY